MTTRQSSDFHPTGGQVGPGVMRPPGTLPATPQKGIMVRLFWD